MTKKKKAAKKGRKSGGFAQAAMLAEEMRKERSLRKESKNSSKSDAKKQTVLIRVEKETKTENRPVSGKAVVGGGRTVFEEPLLRESFEGDPAKEPFSFSIPLGFFETVGGALMLGIIFEILVIIVLFVLLVLR